MDIGVANASGPLSGSQVFPVRESLITRERRSSAVGIKKAYLSGNLITISIGMFQFGYCLESWNSCSYSFELRLGSDWRSFYLPLVTTITILGAMISSLCTGLLTKHGKWRLIHIANLFLVIGSTVSQLDSIFALFAGRFLYGMAAGAFTVLVPKFINETAPRELKGPFGAISQLMVTLGIFVCALLALPMPSKNSAPIKDFYTQNYWHVIWSVPILLACLQSGLLLFRYRFDTPFMLKKAGEYEDLTELMRLLYEEDQIIARVN